MSLEATIKISREARGALAELGKKGESYDAIILRLIEYHRQGVAAATALMKPLGGDIEKEAKG